MIRSVIDAIIITSIIIAIIISVIVSIIILLPPKDNVGDVDEDPDRDHYASNDSSVVGLFSVDSFRVGGVLVVVKVFTFDEQEDNICPQVGYPCSDEE